MYLTGEKYVFLILFLFGEQEVWAREFNLTSFVLVFSRRWFLPKGDLAYLVGMIVRLQTWPTLRGRVKNLDRQNIDLQAKVRVEKDRALSILCWKSNLSQHKKNDM